MTRQEYMDSLARELAGVGEEERQDVLQYFTEFFDEAGPEGEQDVLRDLASPFEVAQQVRSQSSAKFFPPPRQEKAAEEERSVPMPEFDNIDISSSVIKIELIRSHENRVDYRVYGAQRMKVCAVEGRTLRIETERAFPFVDFFFSLFSYIRVYYADSAALKNVRINTTTGAIYTIGALQAETVDISASTGSIRLDSVKADGDIRLNATTGSIHTDRMLEGKNAYLSSKTGSISVDSLLAQGDVEVSMTTGTFSVRDVEARNMQVHSNTGTQRIERAKVGFLRLYTSSGSLRADNIDTDGLEAQTTNGLINISGRLRGRTEARATTGSVKIYSQLPEHMYDYDIHTTTGTCRVNGERIGGRKATNAEYSIFASSKTGSVNLGLGQPI